MVRDRMIEAIKGAAEVNLRYSAIVLKLAKEYVKELDGVVRNDAAPVANGADQSVATSERRPPILLVGQAGSEATGAFILNNTADTELNVGLVVQGELGPLEVTLDPARFVIAPGDSAVVQIRAKLNESMEIGRDHAGAVIAPGLAAQPITFVARRLPLQTPPKRPSGTKQKPPRREAG